MAPVPLLTRAQLLAAAEAAEAEASALELQALTAREQAALLREAAAKAPLTIAGKRSMVSSNMEASTLVGKSERVRTSANRARSTNAARDAMIAGNHTAEDLAKACGVKRPTANAWLVGTRGIAPEHKKTLAKPPFNIPPDSWPKSA